MTGTRKGPCFCLQKDYISARILVGEILYNGVRADFLRKRGQNMTGDLTSDKEKMARERRKRKQLERVRQVERAKQRLRRGVFGGFLVLVFRDRAVSLAAEPAGGGGLAGLRGGK